MRTLARDCCKVYVARYKGKVQKTDSQGRLLGTWVTEFSKPYPIEGSVSAAKGQASETSFGVKLDYDKQMTIPYTNLGIDETSRIWLDVSPEINELGNATKPHDYKVLRVAQSTNFTVLALASVEHHETH